MPSLRELQQAFAGALVATDGRAPACALAGDGADRFAIYRRAVHANYRNALAATYPVVQRLLGTGRFRAAVAAYVRTHPSRGGDLNVYGDAFGAFLEDGATELRMPYLPDLARLEWAIDEASRAADCDGAPDAVLAALARVPAEGLAAARLRLAASCRLVASPHPLLRIWNGGPPAHGADGRTSGAGAGDRLLVRRDACGVAIERLDAGEFAWLAALAAGSTLAGAQDAARVADPAFDLAAALHAHIGAGTIAVVVAA